MCIYIEREGVVLFVADTGNKRLMLMLLNSHDHQPSPAGPTPDVPRETAAGQSFSLSLWRDWRNTVKIILFEISNSMKPYPSVFHAYTSEMRPTIGFYEPENLEVSNRISPTPHLCGS